MAINKVIYFAHAWFLVALERPLVMQSFEAWQHGPVVQDVYRSFKEFGDNPIKSRAKRLDRLAAEFITCESTLKEEELALLLSVSEHYAAIPASQLRTMTHVAGGPWDGVWNYKGSSNPGMTISNELIRAHYRERFVR